MLDYSLLNCGVDAFRHFHYCCCSHYCVYESYASATVSFIFTYQANLLLNIMSFLNCYSYCFLRLYRLFTSAFGWLLIGWDWIFFNCIFHQSDELLVLGSNECNHKFELSTENSKTWKITCACSTELIPFYKYYLKLYQKTKTVSVFVCFRPFISFFYGYQKTCKFSFIPFSSFFSTNNAYFWHSIYMTIIIIDHLIIQTDSVSIAAFDGQTDILLFYFFYSFVQLQKKKMISIFFLLRFHVF
jgi:hypothetical protein